MEVLNAPRRALGLADVRPEEAYRAPLHLYFTAEPFEIEGIDVPASFRLVGPGLWEPPAEPPEWLADLEEPIVLVTASSEFQRDDALVALVLEALRHDDVRVVASTVAHEPWRFDVPPNARLARWLPHGAAIARAACVVCHGGMGITQRALAAGVPVCVVPFGRDQPEVAARVASASAGTWLHPDALSPAALRTAVREAMAMREGARRIAEGFARSGGAPAAADALEALCPAPMAPARDGPPAAVR
jgi:MGT family glycosyltransferase